MQKNNIIAAIDSGKSDVKICTLDTNLSSEALERDCFPTCIGDDKIGGTDLLPGVDTFSCDAIENGRKYKIGSSKLPIKADDNYSKKSLINKICTLYGIARNVNDGDTVDVVIGCPISIFLDNNLRREYCNYILPKGIVSCTINGNKKTFIIGKRLVCAEAIGYINSHPEYFRADIDAAIVDIGSLNMNMTTVHNGIIEIDQSHTNKYGGRQLIADLQRRLKDCDIQLSDEQVIDSIIRGHARQHDPEKENHSIELIAEAVNSYINLIEKELKQCWKNYDSMELYFTGGTSYLLRTALEERFRGFSHFDSCYDDARFANAEGFMWNLWRKINEEVNP